ncbi:hypothetical protein [Mycobacteroides abscessus]|uniref:hypothetical protein n=1 Tax=Mycobacteroides abscessus TaxID=36809 RepID=UPI000C258938|nr:hypothetical protein [Mycobacteroides abscessus]MBN7561403.1 hypothetical protein [Mycobacteroides abscessus subsp. abscessus]
MRAAVVAEWVMVTGGWALFRTMREQALTPELAREVAAWCEDQGDVESAAELRWAAGEAEKWWTQEYGEAAKILAALDGVERGEIACYVVCLRCRAVGQHSVPCGCWNPY